MRRIRYGFAITHKIIEIETLEEFRKFIAKTDWEAKAVLTDLDYLWEHNPREVYIGTHEGRDVYLEARRRRYKEVPWY